MISAVMERGKLFQGIMDTRPEVLLLPDLIYLGISVPQMCSHHTDRWKGALQPPLETQHPGGFCMFQTLKLEQTLGLKKEA